MLKMNLGCLEAFVVLEAKTSVIERRAMKVWEAELSSAYATKSLGFKLN
jgi:hypothetical protein